MLILSYFYHDKYFPIIKWEGNCIILCYAYGMDGNDQS